MRPLIAGLMQGGARAAAAGADVPALAGPAGAAAAAALPASSGEAEEIPYDDGINIAQINGRVKASSVKKVAEVVNMHPDRSVQIIRGWLNNAM